MEETDTPPTPAGGGNWTVEELADTKNWTGVYTMKDFVKALGPNTTSYYTVRRAIEDGEIIRKQVRGGYHFFKPSIPWREAQDL